MDTLEILIAARAEVEKGWCKHALEDDGGNVCLLGALNRAEVGDAYGHGDAPGPYVALCNALPNQRLAPHEFNNAPDTTQTDVLALFDRAIIAEAVKVTADTAHTFATVS
jgi:hypothetical protein